ncbi:MAG: hypothetical protein QW146_07240 [Candidatus Bathyarchaeia archaeon]
MKAIEVYIKTEKRIQPPPGGSYADYDAHPCLQKYNVRRLIVPEQERALKILEKAAEQKNIKLKIYDVATFFGKVKAFVKGVKTTPCTVVGAQRIEGIADLDKLNVI